MFITKITLNKETLTDVTSYSVGSSLSCRRSPVVSEGAMISEGVMLFSARKALIKVGALDLVVDITLLARLARLARRLLCAASISSILCSFRMTVVHTKHTTYTVVTTSVLSCAQMYRSIQT